MPRLIELLPLLLPPVLDVWLRLELFLDAAFDSLELLTDDEFDLLELPRADEPAERALTEGLPAGFIIPR